MTEPEQQRCEGWDVPFVCPTCGWDADNPGYRMFSTGNPGEPYRNEPCPDPFHSTQPDPHPSSKGKVEEWTFSYDDERCKLVTDKPFPCTGPVKVVLASTLQAAEERAERAEELAQTNDTRARLAERAAPVQEDAVAFLVANQFVHTFENGYPVAAVAKSVALSAITLAIRAAESRVAELQAEVEGLRRMLMAAGWPIHQMGETHPDLPEWAREPTKWVREIHAERDAAEARIIELEAEVERYRNGLQRIEQLQLTREKTDAPIEADELARFARSLLDSDKESGG